ncbi:SX2_G0002610.mRNA.1.CDS.1 [Saccharomyces cerevisiae]|nr:SX2_G0002610.mRNA.1.CDS.1 [Saccharomyces cerevisiae]
MMIILFIELCRIADSLLLIPKSSRRTSSIFYIPNIIALLKMESQQLSQNSPTLHISRSTRRNGASEVFKTLVSFHNLCSFNTDYRSLGPVG